MRINDICYTLQFLPLALNMLCNVMLHAVARQRVLQKTGADLMNTTARNLRSLVATNLTYVVYEIF